MKLMQKQGSLQQRHDDAESAEIEELDITTLRRSRLVFGRFLAHFDPRIKDFKAQTLRI